MYREVVINSTITMWCQKNHVSVKRKTAWPSFLLCRLPGFYVWIIYHTLFYSFFHTRKCEIELSEMLEILSWCSLPEQIIKVM
jgi:hypothetical protein